MAETTGRTQSRRRRLSAADLGSDFTKRFSTLTWRHASNEQFVDDVFLDFFYKPHTLSLLGIGGIFLIYSAFVERDAEIALERGLRGFKSMIFIFLCISLVAFPNGPFTRPHPLVWRLVLGISVLYWMGLVFALFQSYGDLRSVLVQYDPTLSESYLSTLDSPDYAADCSLTVGNLWSRADVFLLAHFLGWIVKALLFRSLTVCWISSVTWELTEIIFAPMLPNFYECWWDQFVYDILICNAGGIFIGYKLCRYLEMKSYRWENSLQIRTLTGLTKRAVMQFTPHDWTNVQWDLFSSKRRYLSVTAVVLFVAISELNAFFLKHIFKIPTSNSLNIMRLGLWSVIGAPSIRQLYVYVTDPTCKRLGTQAFCAGGILLTEALICFRFGWPLWPVPLTIQCITQWILMMFGFNSAVLYVHKRFPYLWRRAWWGKASGGVIMPDAGEDASEDDEAETPLEAGAGAGGGGEPEPLMTRARSRQRSVGRKTQ